MKRFAYIRQISGLTLGNGVFALSQWGVLILLAHQLGPAAVGELGFAMAIVAPCLIFGQLALRNAYVTDTQHTTPYATYQRLRWYGTLAACGVALGLGWWHAAHPLMLGTILFFTLAKAVENLSDITYAYHQRAGQLHRVTRSLLFRAGFGFVAFAAALSLTHTLPVGLAALALVWGAVFVLHDRIRQHPHTSDQTQHVQMLHLLRETLPLAITLSFIALNLALPRYFLQGQFGAVEVGVFTAFTALIALGNIVVNAIGQGLSPQLAHALQQRDYRLLGQLSAGLLGGLCMLALAALALAWWYGGPLLQLLYGPSFAAHAPLLPWLVVIATLHYLASLLTYCCTAVRAFTLQLMQTLFTTAAGIAAALFLIPTFGVLGGLWVLGIMSSVAIVTQSGVLLWHSMRRGS